MKWLGLFLVIALGVFVGNLASHAVIAERTAQRIEEAQREALFRAAAARREPPPKPARSGPVRAEPILPPPDHPDAKKLGRACVNGLVNTQDSNGKWTTLYAGGNLACQVRKPEPPNNEH